MLQIKNHHWDVLPTGDPNQLGTRSQRPAWLYLPPVNPTQVDPPTTTRPQKLPIDNLSWEDFERLCLRLVELEFEVEQVSETEGSVRSTKPVARQYGRRGQAQFGIDVYARDRLLLADSPSQRRYTTLQARRIKNPTPKELNNSVDHLLSGKWADVTRKFIYATSASATSTRLADKIEELTNQLIKESIEFEVWDKESVSQRLKGHPMIVDDFFGREWVKKFCGNDPAKKLGTRLDVRQVVELRKQAPSNLHCFIQSG